MERQAASVSGLSDFATANLDIADQFVRVTGETSNGFIEFDYAIGEPELFVELVLAKEDFIEFCHSNSVEILDARDTGNVQADEWGWRMSDATHIRFKAFDEQ